MSTKFTRVSPSGGYDLVDSQTLALTQASDQFRSRMIDWLLSQLQTDGFTDLKANQLNFLGSLDCGVNFASELARTLRISRQAVHKTVKDLEAVGWLSTRRDAELGNQRLIVFTDEGERLMACARKHFLTLDTLLLDRFSETQVAELSELLAFDPFEK